ncbi:MAG: CotH kinase family protein [Acidimicrobiia bacterium]|nr:CotH kinase family protein [Acidimicrobiia bacterium]
MRRSTQIIVSAALSLSLLAGCTAGDSASGDAVAAAGAGAAVPAAAVDSSTSGYGAVGTLDSGVVHTIDISFDEEDYAQLIDAYLSSGDKEWIEATVTIDGSTYEQAGIRLKGNSSLFSLSAASDAGSLPWLIKLDKYVDGQNHEGLTDLVVRSNNSTTALNEAVALELLELAGLASQDAIAVAFSIDGEDPVLRLVIEHPDNIWMAEEFDIDGALYKAESTGDYSYRGDDPDAYDEVFDQEAGKDNADLTPLMEFLDFINNSDDDAFVAELNEWLDIDAFATYLAMQDLINNQDDIDGRGNNSYLYYDTDTGEFTVVAWDHNLAFGVTPGTGGPGPQPGDTAVAPRGEGATPGELGDRPPGPGGLGERTAGPDGQGLEQGNVLVERFLANDTWAALVETKTAELRAELYESGVAEQILSDWSAVVAASGLVDTATIESEAEQIRATVRP